MPVVSIELLDGIASIVRRFEGDDSGSFRTAGRIDVDIGTNDGSFLCYEM